MDLSKFISGGQESVPEEKPRLSKEEYAAVKKQEREEVWAEIDAKAQDVFKDGDSLKGFLDFVAQCKPQKTPNLLLLYSQNPEIRQVMTFDKLKSDGLSLRAGVKGYKFLIGQEYEKDGITMQGTSVGKAYDISQIRTRQPEVPEQKDMETMMGALLTNSDVPIRIADNLPEGVQAQYIPRQRTIYVRNGMSETTTFHAINRELSCASMDHHDGSYARNKVSAKAFCAAYVVAQKYGVDTSGFKFDKVCEMQGNGDKDPKELRSFIGDVRNAAYSINNHINRNLGEQEQEFVADEFGISEGQQAAKSGKSKKQPER
jgi:hypothetical protein